MLDEEQTELFRQHCLKEYPREACGLVVSGKFIPTPNSSETPLLTFRIDPIHLVKASQFGTVEAVLHSHPYKPSNRPVYPPEWISAWDMTHWMRNNLPWGIAACDGEGISQVLWYDDSKPAPLVGREFIHGLNDCYSAIRDWYRMERQITLPNYARDMEWWQKGEDLYSQNFAHAGFYEIPFEQVTTGDVVMFQVRSPVINHAAVVSNTNEILHHLIHRLSGHDQLSRWTRSIVKAVRYGCAK